MIRADHPDFRYSGIDFPAYRHRPGKTPHPVRHPQGHSHGREGSSEPFEEALWRSSSGYLHGVDLYNFAYYWEAHEAWEPLWRSARRGSREALFLRSLIQISGALLKREERRRVGMRSLAARGLGGLWAVAREKRHFAGLDLLEFVSRLERISAAGIDHPSAEKPWIRLIEA